MDFVHRYAEPFQPHGRTARGAHDGARGLEADLDPVRAVVALRRGRGIRVDVERVVRAGLHARLAADAAAAVEIHDAVVAPIERDRRANGHTGRGVAVVAAQHGEIPAGGWGHTPPPGIPPKTGNRPRDPRLLPPPPPAGPGTQNT